MCEEEETPTVFVVPPNNSLKCPLHFGVLEDPVDAPCGCTFCRSCITQLLATKHECPLHERPIYLDQLRPNEHAKVIVDDLLIHCKGGLQKTVSGEWITSPSGCKLWITLGNRKEHEDSCVHIKKQLNNASDTDKPSKPPIRTCVYYQYGCLFVGHTDQEMLLHQEMCGCGKLLQHISQLKSQLTQKDAEIARLNALVAEQDNTIKYMPSASNVNNILDSMSQGLERLDQESTRLFEDAKSTLQKTKTSFKNSSVYQTSLEVLNSIKEVVETARAEFVAKFEELERMAKYKFRQLTGGNDLKRITNQPENNTTTNNNDVTTTDTTNTTTTTTTTDDTNNDTNNNSNTNSNDDVTPGNPDLSTTPSETIEIEGDADLKEFLEASKQEYLREQSLRMAEEESVRQAMRLSLLDLMK